MWYIIYFLIVAFALIAIMFCIARIIRTRHAINRANKYKFLVVELNNSINLSYDLSDYFSSRDKLTNLLQDLSTDERYIKKHPITPVPSKILKLLSQNESLHVHTAIQRMTDNYLQLIKTGNNISELFLAEINQFRNRLGEENFRFANTCLQVLQTSESRIKKQDELLLEQSKLQIITAKLIEETDGMDGHQFEYWCADLLKKSGFSNVEVTAGSGDQGVDITAIKDDIHYAVQCKCYANDIGNKPVQEVYAGKEMYQCQVGVVMTNRYFTAGAKQLAEKTKVLLWDRDKLRDMLQRTSSKHMVNLSTDPLFTLAVQTVIDSNIASVSVLQRKLQCSYAHAARLIDEMERLKIVGPFNGSSPREILITKDDWSHLRQTNIRQ